MAPLWTLGLLGWLLTATEAPAAAGDPNPAAAVARGSAAPPTALPAIAEDPRAHGLFAQARTGLGAVLKNAAVAPGELAQGRAGRSEGLLLGGQVELSVGFELHRRLAVELAAGLQALGSRGTPRLRGLMLASGTAGLRYLQPLGETLHLAVTPRGGVAWGDSAVDAPRLAGLAGLAVGLLWQPPLRHLQVGMDVAAAYAWAPGRLTLFVLPTLDYTF